MKKIYIQIMYDCRIVNTHTYSQVGSEHKILTGFPPILFVV